MGPHQTDAGSGFIGHGERRLGRTFTTCNAKGGRSRLVHVPGSFATLREEVAACVPPIQVLELKFSENGGRRRLHYDPAEKLDWLPKASR